MGIHMKNSVNYTGGGMGVGATKLELTLDEYEALTPEEKNNGTMYFLTDVNGDGEQFQPIIYSEDEREIGVWTDGKPLYQKTFNTTSSSSTSTAAVLADTGENTEIIEFYGIINGSRNIISLLDENQWSYSWIATNKHQIANFAKGNVYISLPCIVTCLYTKTIDAPGSGQWTPQGIPAVHYDDDEKMVGTWFGETLYEKSFQFTNSSTGNISVPIDININEVASIDGAIHRADNRWFPINYAADSFGWAINVGNIISNTTISIECGSSLSGQYLIDKGVITIRYTKSTS